MPEQSKFRFGTLAVHAGQEPEPTTGAIMTPIFQTSTYVQPAVAEPKLGYDYARVANPTTRTLERNIATLEGGKHGIAFSSGLAAIEAVVKRLSAGDHVVSEENTYGGTTRMFTRVLAKLGIEFSFVNTSDPEAVRKAVEKGKTKILHVETPTNPMMRLCDIRAMSDIAHEADAILMVDNTFASPYNQRPFEAGADVIMHSTTKYLNGHSDVIAGALITAHQDDWWRRIRYVRSSLGAMLGPFEAWLLLRGIRTLNVRVEASSRTALHLATQLQAHRGVIEVLYPGLANRPGHDVALRQMEGGFGGMLSIRVAGGADAAIRVAGRLKVWKRATSLGGVESLVEHRASVEGPGSPCPPDLLRLSVGLEAVSDLLADLEQALA